MDYAEYIEIQTDNAVKKPLRYRVGERRAIDWFFKHISREVSILDIGCGSGIGLNYLRDLGYYDAVGIDLNPKKVEFALRRGHYVICGDFIAHNFHKNFDVVWMSHSIEHMFDTVGVIEKVLNITRKDAMIFIVAPYPDLDPAPAHCASHELGLDVDDDSVAFRKWLSSHGVNPVLYKYDDYRESEVWVEAWKI